MSADSAENALRRPVMLMMGSSAVLPVIGLISAPVLAQGLGADGRGIVSAAGAPGTLLIGVAAFGLPEALTYFVAKDPVGIRRAVGAALVISTVLGFVALGITAVALPFLDAGDDLLGRLILLGTALAIPQLLIGVLRGAATGVQLWRWVASERLISSGSRLIVLVVLLLTGELTPTTAVVTISLSAIVSGLAYLPLIPHLRPIEPGPRVIARATVRQIVGFGGRTWLGAIAGVVLSRIGQILFAPLSGVGELGLFVVAITIADVPLIIAFAVRDALYGVSSRSSDADQVARTTRVTLVLTAGICVVLGGSVAFWIGPLFGETFVGAIVPTWLLMGTALISVPSYLAAAGLAAWGRPGARSIGLVGTLVVYVLAFVAVVPSSGAVGAGVASLISGAFSTAYMVTVASRTLHMPARMFLVPRPDDFLVFGREVGRVSGRLRALIAR